MVEILAGPLIGDLTSAESLIFDEGRGATPKHGELLIAMDPSRFTGAEAAAHSNRADALFNAVESQGARLPSQRRYRARRQTIERGTVEIPKALYDDIIALVE